MSFAHDNLVQYQHSNDSARAFGELNSSTPTVKSTQNYKCIRDFAHLISSKGKQIFVDVFLTKIPFLFINTYFLSIHLFIIFLCKNKVLIDHNLLLSKKKHLCILCEKNGNQNQCQRTYAENRYDKASK